MKITACYLLSSVNMWIRIDHPHNISCIPYTFDSLSISLLRKKKTLTKVKAENELMLSRFEQKARQTGNANVVAVQDTTGHPAAIQYDKL
ncbi:unnamed protein product [Brassica napus]|uniref:(rape) hypothetical protein n=1 Tax=Brassica napus TaxID=3708 RepID=A0A816R3X2_BRANA|nr:unnamed protein product [Brassica napus]